MKNRYINFLIILVWPIIASAIALFFGVKTILVSIILFLVLPSLYLSYLLPKSIIKSLIFSFVGALPIYIVIDYILHINGQWFVPTIFSFRFLDAIPLEDFFWSLFFAYFVVMFYEFFFEFHNETKKWHPRMYFFIALLLFIFFVFLGLYLFYPNLLNFSYAYFFVAFFLLFLPAIIEIIYNPKLIRKLLPSSFYFLFLNFIYEITAIKLGWWHFPSSQYVGMFSIFNVQFPLEELFFYVIFLAVMVLATYDTFDDYKK